MGVDVGTLFAMGGANSGAILNDGQWYRLLTAALLHADALHLLFNGVALGLAGYLLEALIGPAWLVVLFFLGALGGSLMGLAVNSAEVVSVGASGAVMGLLAAALVASLRLPRGQERHVGAARLWCSSFCLRCSLWQRIDKRGTSILRRTSAGPSSAPCLASCYSRFGRENKSGLAFRRWRRAGRFLRPHRSS